MLLEKRVENIVLQYKFSRKTWVLSDLGWNAHFCCFIVGINPNHSVSRVSSTLNNLSDMINNFGSVSKHLLDLCHHGAAIWLSFHLVALSFDTDIVVLEPSSFYPSESCLNPFASFVEASSLPAISVEPVPGAIYNREVCIYLLVNSKSNLMSCAEEVLPRDCHAPSGVVRCVASVQELKII